MQSKTTLHQNTRTETPLVLELKGATNAGLSPSVPTGWPTQLNSGLVWDGADFSHDGGYILTLNELEKQEIAAALAHFKSLGLHGSAVNRENFRLPILTERLEDLAIELHSGRGFFVLRGLQPETYSHDDNILIFLGLSSYVGDRRGKQNDEGNMLAHVRNSTVSKAPQEYRPTKDSNIKIPFHTDLFCDILAMQTLGLASKGGRQTIVSGWKIYNELVLRRPDLVQVLARDDWPIDTDGYMFPRSKRPILYYEDGHIIFNFFSGGIMGSDDIPRSEGYPKPSALQLEALGVLESLADKHKLVLDTQLGDLTFHNNLAILHAREGFTDNLSQTRHLIRLWLRNDSLRWAMPLALQEGNRRLFDEGPVMERWNLNPDLIFTFTPRQRLEPY